MNMTDYEMKVVRDEVIEVMVAHRVAQAIKEGNNTPAVIRIRSDVWNEVVESFSTKVMKKFYK